MAAQALAELVKNDRGQSRDLATGVTKKNVVRAVEVVAGKLGNTKAVCRKCYIHPEIINAYLDGSLIGNLAARAEKMANHGHGLRPEEASVLKLLRQRLVDARKARAKQPRTVVEALRRSLKTGQQRKAS